jgi:serine/threonine protein kinase
LTDTVLPLLTQVIKNSKDFFDQSLDEIKLLQYINSKGDPHKNNVLKMTDFFYCKEHLFIVSELLRENLYDFGKYIRESGAEPYFTRDRLKRIMHQVLEALVYIQSLGLIHCDIKPENIVIKSYSRCEVKLIDFGSSCFSTDHLTTYIQSRSYRAPEVILGMPYDFRIDIWSLGGVLAEMLTGYVLFQNDSIATMLARITGILGPFPVTLMQNQTECGKYFVGGSNIVYECNEEGYFIVHPKKSNIRRRLHVFSEPSEHGDSEDDLFVDFVLKMLELDPCKRWTAVDALAHPWLRNVHEIDVSYVASA